MATSEVLNGPSLHIPAIQGEYFFALEKDSANGQISQIFGYENVKEIPAENIVFAISNTNFTLFLFLILTIIFIFFANLALKKEKSKLKTAISSTIGFLDKYIREIFNDDKFSRGAIMIIFPIFFVVLFGNLMGLLIDWTLMAIPSLHLYEYLRPVHSDINTTLGLGLITVVAMLSISIKYQGGFNTIKGYLFNFSGHGIGEKVINVFVGWLHILSIPSTLFSLSLRLFGNIFAGIILVGVIGYLGSLATQSLLGIGGLLTIPFWFFEVMVAVIQAIVFVGLMIAYFEQSKDSKH